MGNDERAESPSIAGSFVFRVFPGLSKTAGME